MQIYDNKLFKNPLSVIKSFDGFSLQTALDKIEELARKYYLIGYIKYEALDFIKDKDKISDYPILYFEVFDNYETFVPQHSETVSINVNPTLSFDEYSIALEKIRSEISAGNTYEVNYTFDFDVEFKGNYISLYNYLMQYQKTDYNAFIQNEYEVVLSFSPELFFEIEGRHIITKPMKGTVKRGKEDDKKLIEFLKSDLKNRAENVMIVDLLRNDLGRISKTASVNVSKLFEVETYHTLHTMVSVIESDLLDEIKLSDVFKAVFPCGSVTGAPKVSTMQIIDKIESGSRNIYCGAIGFLCPEKMTFSVPIRILQGKTGGNLRYRTGGAIVWDSNVRDEWLEAFTKTRFLTGDFKIIETFKADSVDIQKHLKRMEKTALYFNYPFKLSKIPKIYGTGIVQVLLDKKGCFEVEYKEFIDDCSDLVKISKLKVDSKDDFLKYKTNWRPYYNVDYKQFYDELFFNEKGELTEGSRTNIVLEIDGRLYTPPCECGLLNGVFRQNLLDSGLCQERILYENDLLDASAIYCVSSLYGMRKVVLI